MAEKSDSLEALRKIAKRNQEAIMKDDAAEKERKAKAREFDAENIIDDEFVGPTGGRVGLVSPETRQGVRKSVAELPGAAQFATEITPSIIGAGIGGALGTAVGGPIGTVLGGAGGGVLGELFAQESGVAPESNVALGLSAAPLAGPVAGKMAQAAGRGLSTAVSHLPAVRAAVGKLTMQRAAGELESLGTTIVGNRTGMAAKDADVLYAAAKSFGGADVPIENFKDTLRGVGRLIDVYAEFPGMEAASKKAAKALASVLDPATKSVGMDDIMVMYKATNELAEAAHKTPGVKAEMADDIFKMFDEDIDTIVASGEKGGRRAAFVQAAFKRTQLDRAVQGLERGIAQFTQQSPESGDVLLNVEELRTWLFNKTNPKHASYDKNMATELGKDLPDLKKKLDMWTKLSHGALNPAGPGSIVVRNIGARTGAGVVGGLVGGPLGAGVGAIAGARLPEGITGILMTPKGRALMDAMLRMGKGSINQQRWGLLSQVATQAAVRPMAQAGEGVVEDLMGAE